MNVAIPRPLRFLPAGALFLLVSAAPPGVFAASPVPEGPTAQVVSQGPQGLVLRIRIPAGTPREVTLPGGGTYWAWDIPGLEEGSGAPAGTPDLPHRGFPFGIPDGTVARLGSVRILASTTTSGRPPLPAPTDTIGPPPEDGAPAPQRLSYEPKAAAYAATSWVPASVVELGPSYGYRHQRVQSLIVNPVRAVPATGAYETVQELEVEIRFEAKTGASSGARIPVGRDAPGWDETFDRLLVNSESARTFRTRAAPAAAPSPGIAAGATYLRVRIGDTGLCRIPYADLAAAGWPAGVAIANVRVEERGYDKNLADPFTVLDEPRLVEDTNGNGTFDGGDFLVFYGMNYKDRFNPPFYDARYSFFHTYWVTDAAAGADYPQVDGYPAGTYAPMDSFPDTRTYEQNLIYMNNPPDSGSFDLPIYDTDYWLDTDQLDTDLRFTVQDLAPGSNYRVRARWQGKDLVAQTRIHIVSLDLNGTQIMPEQTFYDRFPLLWEGPFAPAAGLLQEGSNTVTVHTHTDNPAVTRNGCYFDWYEVTYGRRLVAHGNQLAFNTGTVTGLREIAITGFTAPDVFVLDVTDPTAPFQVLPHVTNAGTSWTATIRVDLGGGGTPRRYLAAVRSSITGLPPTTHSIPPDLGTAAIAPGLPRDLLAAGEGSDYILITHPDFESAWQPLVDYRDQQGHQVFLCNVWEIYDEFAGGDKTPWAIQRFLTQAFRSWDPSPSYLLLGGDASEDYRSELATSDPDWVPTIMAFGDVTGSAGLELSGTDPWYVDFLKEGDDQFDIFPDMHEARIPAGTPAEVQAVVQKIIAYEDPNADDSWKSRGFFLADDQYSSGILSSTAYCYSAGESVFRTTTQAMVDSIHVQAGLQHFYCEKFFLADYLDTVAALGREPGNPANCPQLFLATNYTRPNVTPVVLDSLSKGGLIWEFTGHANKNQITHEALLLNRPGLTSATDIAKINNLGKPYLFMGYACHLMEFEGYREKTDGESIGEYLLLAPNRGAIAVMAAPSYEWLQTNPLAQRYTTRALFWNLPRDPATGRPQRIFTDCMNRALTALVLEQARNDANGMLRTYQSFGDPALVIDVWSARFPSVSVNGAPWEDGKALTAPSFTDSVAVAATISDDVDVSSIEVADGGTTLPSERVQILRPPASQEGAQTYQVAFKTLLRLGNYDVTVRATDWSRRVSTLTLPVHLDIVFTSGGKILDPHGSNTVDPEGSVLIQVANGVPLEAGAFTVVVDGNAYTGFAPQFVNGTWQLEVPGPWSGGDHTVEIEVGDQNTTCEPGPCPIRASVPFSVSTGSLAISQAYFYPNPLEGVRGTLVYNLNRDAVRAQISIYTVRGRRVLRQEVPALAGLNAFQWDLRDERGDRVANGVYLAVLRITGDRNEIVTNASDPVRIAVTR